MLPLQANKLENLSTRKVYRVLLARVDKLRFALIVKEHCILNPICCEYYKKKSK